ncbi:MAG: hypothetical protein U5N58_05025 [Actinomycetota bacterium]|nr:hypothetical protein [Actinomycetota bacterium]
MGKSWITASDPSGASESAQIIIVLTVPPASGEEEAAHVYEVSADSGLSGYISADGVVRTGVVMVGDSNSDIQLKGYLTFYLEDFPDVSGDQITDVLIDFEHVNKSGNPENIGTFVDFKVFDYGNSLDRDDFAVGGRRFSMIGTGTFGSGSTARSSLITEVRRILAEGGDRLQVKIGLNGTTDNNGLCGMYLSYIQQVLSLG